MESAVKKTLPRMKPILPLLTILTLGWLAPAHAAETWLWEIGRADGRNGEFALAPGRLKEYREDGFHVVGASESQRDWPYIQPGPQDGWAGNRPHTFSILFGLKTRAETGDCQLVLDLLDTHQGNPPKLDIQINGRLWQHSLPPGAGDHTAFGEADKGKKHRVAITFPCTNLITGDNQITITTREGSWFLYDQVALAAPAGVELGVAKARTVLVAAESVRALRRQGFGYTQPLRVVLRHFGEPAKLRLRVQEEASLVRNLTLTNGEQEITLQLAAIDQAQTRMVIAEVNNQVLARRSVLVKPVRKLTVYVLPHSHTDIGYTDLQTAIADKQVTNLLQGMAYARQTATNPPGSRFVWNVEVLWAADLYWQRLNEQQRGEFLAAVKQGQVGLNGMYLNELTGLCRPEELVRLFRHATRLAELTGTPVDSAMISDVPGYTWGTVPAMNQAGIRYFSTAPNYFDRIGTILKEWENKPFYWMGPDGESKVLVWIPFWGYAMSHRYGTLTPKLVEDFCDGLDKRNYPYDIAHVRWSGQGDNAVPDPSICGFIRDWNLKYAWPRFVIATTSEAFRAFEQKYGGDLPQVRGDWTPYWEDGAGSSARETAQNRASSDRLAQAETLFALWQPRAYPAAEFTAAWNQVLLYSEHTWGAWCSVSEPERKETVEQWAIKQSYATAADRQSTRLFNQALALRGAETTNAVDVWNTASWPRTELVTVSAALSRAGDRVLDDQGRPAQSQRLRNGDLAFLVKDLPPLAGRRYAIHAGRGASETLARVNGATLDNGLVRVRVNEQTGGIEELAAAGIAENLADTRDGESLNDYLYLVGDNLTNVARNGAVTLRPGEPGPLVASLIVESDAPGCQKLIREIRLVAGLGQVELDNLVIKTRQPGTNHLAKEGKESVNFAFPFRVPGGQMRLEVPYGLVRPDADQMPSACKNWFTVGSWADVSAADQGITWVTLDAPLVQVGGLTANLLNSQSDPEVWRKTVGPTGKLYSWAMNNHWGTNYRAYQEGPVRFRFRLRPHRQFDAAEAARFAGSQTQPLVAMAARGPQPSGTPLLQLNQPDVLVTALKPSDDGQALIIRLFGTGPVERETSLQWPGHPPSTLFRSGTAEKPGHQLAGRVVVPAQGLVTVRAEF
jgi:hypothetical protein